MGEPVELTDDTTDADAHDSGDAADAVEDEMLVEEISIDGMCGVY